MDLESLRERVASGEGVVGGVLSGTSADGIDVVLARPRTERGRLRAIEPLAFSIEPYPAGGGERLRAVLDGEAPPLREIALLHRDIGRAFGEAAHRVAERAGVELALLGSHGQTVWHHDGRDAEGAASLQLGDGDWVAEAAGCAVASDFRQRDIAAGGEGAPLSACADDVVFAAAPRPLCVLNLGGMANLTWIDHERVVAFDTGPANALLDGLARRLLGTPCDRDGRAAAAGRVDRAALEELGAHPFFTAVPPKSTGRDTFGEGYVDSFLVRVGGAPADRLATATELVAQSVARAVREHLPARPEVLWLAGGGTRNPALVARLARAAGTPALSTAEIGVDPDAREAMVFAVLGARALLGEPATRPGATGARPGRVLGKLSSPNP